MKSFRWALIPHKLVPLYKGKFEYGHIKKQEKTAIYKTRNIWGYWKLEEKHGTDLFLNTFRRNMALPTLWFGHLASELWDSKFLFLINSVCGPLLWQSYQTNTVRNKTFLVGERNVWAHVCLLFPLYRKTFDHLVPICYRKLQTIISGTFQQTHQV